MLLLTNIKNKDELNKWTEVKKHLKDERITLGPYFSYQLRNTPRRILFALSRYKFAAKLIGEEKSVLEVGCSEGLGTVLLAEFNNQIVGIDIDSEAIEEANRTFANAKIQFRCIDILGSKIGDFNGIVSFDVIEHIFPENENLFFKSLLNNLNENGICIIGTPNVTADVYASETSRMGHVNMYSWDRLKFSLERYFKQVLIFSSNDEMIHTGFYPMAHYLIGVGIGKK